MTAFLRLGFVLIFATLVLAPLGQMATRLIPEQPLIENRVLAAWPKGLEASHQLVRGASDWFNDNFGLRALLIRIKTQIDYSLFKTSDRVHIGSRGWLFYRSVLDVERPNVEAYLAINSEAVRAGIVALSDAFKRNGIQTIFVLNEMADRFYPEMVPGSALPAKENPRIRQLERSLASAQSIAVVDATAILRETAKSRQVFHKTDFHWNDTGAFEVARRVVALASAAEDKPATIWSHPLSIATQRFSGGIATFMPLLRSPKEDMLVVKPDWPMPPDFRQDPPTGIFEFSIHFPTTGPRLLKPLTILGDSFTDGFTRSGIYLYFSDTYRIRWNQVPKLSVFARELPLETRHVLIQMIEVQYGALLAFADKADIDLAVKTIDERFRAR
ncbi:hypothetical protein ABIE41_000603 [Bosea sp. OAE506]|uniref:alginate O-acetyltransferase AlgX-related protein n=1 Tax=Bosea sp. OAE506 TaxID=2663870 RepID=UPI00178A8C37